MKPFDTYPEQRARLLTLAHEVQTTWIDVEKLEKKAQELANLVQLILEDEAIEVRCEEGPPSATT